MLRVQQKFIITKHIKLPKKGYNTGMVKEIIKYETPTLCTIIVQQKQYSLQQKIQEVKSEDYNINIYMQKLILKTFRFFMSN